MKIDTTEHGLVPHIVIYRRRDLYVRAGSLEAGQAFLRWLTDKWSEIKAGVSSTKPNESEIQQPEILSTQSIGLDGVYRAIAKIAYNYMAYRRGAEFALQVAFEPIREYIAGRSLIHPDPLPEGAIAVDTCFVRRMEHGEVIAEAWDGSGCHLRAVPYLSVIDLRLRSADVVKQGIGNEIGPRYRALVMLASPRLLMGASMQHNAFQRVVPAGVLRGIAGRSPSWV